ncbi:MAG TPA: HAMP domain-containing sensor histidine kinase [Dongiaceae bacterium]|nr:HAMP domain-containing sensor histidine kinase [Dongiaceae bacterium]
MTDAHAHVNHPAPPTLANVQQNEWRLLQVYLYYRLLLSLSLLAALLFGGKQTESFNQDQQLYFATAATYFVLTVLSLLTARLRTGRLSIQVFIIIVTDILAIALLEYANGQSNSNLTILLVVSVAAGSILVEGKLANFFAAIATLGVLYREIYLMVVKDGFSQPDLLQSAMIGIACFATSILAQQIAKRLRESSELAGRQAADLANLEELNHHIIQRMRTGILVVDSNNQIVLVNDACWKLFGMPTLADHDQLENISPELALQLSQWRQNPFARSRPFRALSGPEVQANFTLLETGGSPTALIFIDDNTRMAQQAQQLKLASLGGLTASIAHEIRNPLGAISHASQLLQESPQLAKGDVRLAEIIHQHCVRMNKVIENVLQLSRRKQVEPELFNMQDWLEHFIADFKATQNETVEIEFKITRPDLTFRIDPSQIGQVLTNLFQNGLRYSEKNTGRRYLRVVADFSIQTEQPTLDIIDRGPGVPEEARDKIFEPFYTSEKSGTGLGLYIARELCEANQARLDYIPTRSGSCFRITFSHPARIVTI